MKQNQTGNQNVSAHSHDKHNQQATRLTCVHIHLQTLCTIKHMLFPHCTIISWTKHSLALLHTNTTKLFVLLMQACPNLFVWCHSAVIIVKPEVSPLLVGMCVFIFCNFFLWVITASMSNSKDWYFKYLLCQYGGEGKRQKDLLGETFSPVYPNAFGCCVVELVRIWHSSEEPKCIRRNNFTIVQGMHATFWVVVLGVTLTFFGKNSKFSFKKCEFEAHTWSELTALFQLQPTNAQIVRCTSYCYCASLTQKNTKFPTKLGTIQIQCFCTLGCCCAVQGDLVVYV